MTTAFETEPCTRCGGTGKFSHNGEHDRCYKCDGKNGARSYTKRGRAAKDFYLRSLVIAPEDVKVGDVIRTYGIKRLTVAKIEMVNSGKAKNLRTGEETDIIHYVYTNATGLAGSAQKTQKPVDHNSIYAVRRIPSVEENKRLIAEALAFQATLTKNGKARK